MADGLNGKAMAAISFGMLMVWSGVKGWSLSAVVGDVITGKKPSDVVTTDLFAPGTATGAPGGTALTGGALGVGGVSNLVHAALQGLGHAYLFGGAPGRDGTRPWDCSSFMNWTCGAKCGLAIPGYAPGKYDGSVHGPPSGAWAIWPGLRSITKDEVQGGDIIVWGGHVGMAVNNTQMISALNPKSGTKVTVIEGTGRGPIIRRGRYI